MANWLNINDIVDEEWWENAYKLFLEYNPVENILRHSQLYLTGKNLNDYEFSCKTRVPPPGKVNDVSKRAILVVISRSMKNKWSCMDLPQSSKHVPDLKKKSQETYKLCY